MPATPNSNNVLVKPLTLNLGFDLIAGAICTVFICGFFGPTALADEEYKETRAYQEYLLLPDSYKSPEMEEKFKRSYDAENAVKNHPCTAGSTVSDCLDNMATQQGYDDLGWNTSGEVGQLQVERVFVTWTGKAITYQWIVDESGNVRAKNKEARELSNNKARAKHQNTGDFY